MSFIKKSFKTCDSCGKNHNRASCRFRSSKCHLCNKVGHIASVCRSKSGQNQIETGKDDRSSSDQETNTVQFVGINVVSSNKQECNPTPKLKVNVLINGKKMQMELDTGGACSMINIQCLKIIIPNVILKPTSKQFRSYTNEKFKCVGRNTL